jgi:hypothetical protein
MRRQWILFAVAALAVAPGCKNARRASPPPERNLEQTSFPHSPHLEVGCDTCHEAAKWNRLGEYRAPTASKCEECHDRKTPADQAKFSPPVREARQTYELRFSHADHVEIVPMQRGTKGDATCTYCHEVLPEPGEKRDVTPAMDTCTSCHHHEQEVAEAKCTPCHVSLKRFPAKPLTQFTEFAHQGNFIREHGRLAKAGAETCAQCHDQTYCSNCHATATLPMKPELRFPENVRSDFIHRGDYISRHHLEAESDPALCRRCHGSEFCESCHREHRLTTTNNPHASLGGGRRWIDEHGQAARRNIVACAGCHDENALGGAGNCASCHAVGGSARVNPHPPSWSRSHELSDTRDNAMCRTCHR